MSGEMMKMRKMMKISSTWVEKDENEQQEQFDNVH